MTIQLHQKTDTDEIIKLFERDLTQLMKLMIPHEVELHRRHNKSCRSGDLDPNDLDRLILHFAVTQVALVRTKDQKRLLQITESN